MVTAIGKVLAKDLLPGQRYVHDELGPRHVLWIETNEDVPDNVIVHSSYRREGPTTLSQEMHGDSEVTAEVQAQ